MNNCVFCSIVRHEDQQSERIVFEDSDFVVLLVSHPATRGHCVVLPRKHASELKDLPNKGALLEVTSDYAEQLVEAIGAKAYVLKLNNNLFKLESDELHIGHVHMHVVPRYSPEDHTNDRPAEADTDYFRELLVLLDVKNLKST